jgi:uncharacterized membrane protein
MQEKKLVKFFMTTVIGGVIFLVPVVFLVVIILKAIDLMMLIARPLANWLPLETIGGVALADIIAIMALLLICFVAGMVARQALAGNLMRQLETRLLEKLPGYAMIKNVLKGFDTSQEGGVKPVIVKLGSAERAGFEVQRLADGRSVVFIPDSPNAFSGITLVLPPDQVTHLDVPLNRVIECSQNYGHGLDSLVQAKGHQADT